MTAEDKMVAFALYVDALLTGMVIPAGWLLSDLKPEKDPFDFYEEALGG